MKKTNNWSQRFDEEFGDYIAADIVGEEDSGIRAEFKDFICAEVNKVLDSLEMDKKELMAIENLSTMEYDRRIGYNDAVQELKAKIQKLREEYK